MRACLLRATGNLPKAIDAFSALLTDHPEHLDAQEHLYGFTCGLLPPRESFYSAAVNEFQAHQYDRVVKRLSETWIVSDAQLVLLISSLTLTGDAARLYQLGQELVDRR